jgi:ribulose-phosphate 3-epimerase
MKLIRTEDAAGQVLCHDITQIIPGEFKGARFRKGHIIQPEDIPVLLSIGKENLYVWEKKPGILHEDEAAALLYKAAAGKNIHGTEPKEGKIELIADCDGLLKINREALLAVNRTPQMMIATIHGDLPVKKGQKLAGTRIIPLVIEQEKMDAMQAAAGSEPILNVLPMQAKKFAVITTGSEVFKGRIEDKFTPILVGKLAEYGCEMTFHKVCDDDPAGITAAILEAKAAGCELIFTTGGMSVDPDDRTPLAIRNTGADIVTCHVEADTEENILSALDKIHAKGKKAGVVVKPKTPASAVLPFIDKVELILVMTVEPGFGGQKFMADMMPKVQAIRGYIDAMNPACELEVDGGVDGDTCKLCIASGANVLVAGSAVYKAADIPAKIKELRG